MLARFSLSFALVIALSPNVAHAKKKLKAKRAEVQQVQARSAPAAKPSETAYAPNDLAMSLDDDPRPAYGQDLIAGKSNGSMRMLVQARYRSTFVRESGLSSSSIVAEQQKGTLQNNDGFDIQRAFLRYVASPTKQIDAKFLVDFAELKHNNVSQSFKLAYVESHITKRLQIDFGLLKRTYSLLELLPIAQHELADLGPTDDFIKNQGYAGRDIGAVIRYQPLPMRRMMTVSVGAYRGDIDEGFDASPLKLLGVRIEARPVKHLRLGANAVWRPYANVEMQKTVDDNTGGIGYQKNVTKRKGAAAGTDVTLTYQHLEVRGELLLGQRTDPIQPLNGSQGSFWSAWLLVSPKIPVGKWLLVPAAKAEILDTDALNSGGRRRVLSGVLGVMPASGLRIIADVTHTWTDVALTSMQSVPWTSGASKIYVPEPSATSVTLQSQLVF